jgi:hypothetical protein
MAWIIGSEEQELTEAEVAGLVGGYFTTEKSDHKCKTCLSRVIENEGEDRADCTRVAGGISLGRGTCDLWKSGDAATKTEIADDRLDYNESGYIETPDEDFQVICGTCQRYDKIDEGHGLCKLWMRKVDAPYCCAGYKNGEVKSPS